MVAGFLLYALLGVVTALITMIVASVKGNISSKAEFDFEEYTPSTEEENAVNARFYSVIALIWPVYLAAKILGRGMVYEEHSQIDENGNEYTSYHISFPDKKR